MATDLRSWAARQRAPFSLILAASLALFALIGWITQSRASAPLAFMSAQPWGALTYPWAFNPLASMFGLITLLIVIAALVQFGGAIEREMDTPRFAIFWIVATLLFALVAGAFGAGLVGPLLPGCALIVLWCARNRSATLMVWGILPLSGVAMAVVVAASVIFTFGAANPLYGLAIALPLLLAYLFGLDRLPISVAGGRAFQSRGEQPVVKGGTKYDDAYYENVKKREIEREEQERLRKLFEGK